MSNMPLQPLPNIGVDERQRWAAHVGLERSRAEGNRAYWPMDSVRLQGGSRPVCLRIEELTRPSLHRAEDGNWTALYRNPCDNRLWKRPIPRGNCAMDARPGCGRSLVVLDGGGQKRLSRNLKGRIQSIFRHLRLDCRQVNDLVSVC